MRVLVLVAFVALLAACGSGPRLDHACGTLERPPVAVPRDWCDEGTGVWYSAPAADVSDPDERPVIGQPLDGDWWDAADRSERRPTTVVPPPSASPSTAYVPARPTSSTPKSAPPTTRRR